MKEDFDRMREIQTIDLRIHEIEQSRSDFPVKLEELEKAIENVKSDCERLKASILEYESDRAKTQKDIQLEKEMLTKSQGKLTFIQTNREYDAVHDEIDTHQRKVKVGEENTQGLGAKKQKAEEELKTAEELLQETLEKNEPVIKQLKEEIAQIDDKIGKARRERETLAKDIPVRMARTYDRILKGRRNAQVLGYVSKDNPNCSFCHKSLTLQQMNEVRRNDPLVACDNCGSILVWEEQS